MSTCSSCPGWAPSGAVPSSTSLRMSWIPESPESAIAPSRTSFAPV